MEKAHNRPGVGKGGKRTFLGGKETGIFTAGKKEDPVGPRCAKRPPTENERRS